MQNKHTFHAEGMHCASCVIYLEETLKDNAGVIDVQANLAMCTVTVSSDRDSDPRALAEKLTALISNNGYRLTVEKAKEKKTHREFLLAVPAALTAIIGFLLLQKLGLINLITASNVSYGTAVFIGLIASVSTCLAVVGGLVLSLSAHAAKNQTHWRAQVMFHTGRLGGFFVLGGIIGSAGKLFQLDLVGNAILGIIIAVVMMILGLNLLDTFPILKRLQLKLPNIFARHTVRASNSSHMLAPFIVGIGTFFLPCGFTQSMQVYTLTTENFLTGGLTMLAFALGTLPMLALLSFGALEISHKSWKGIFFKAAGIVIIALALFNAWNSLHILNIL